MASLRQCPFPISHLRLGIRQFIASLYRYLQQSMDIDGCVKVSISLLGAFLETYDVEMVVAINASRDMLILFAYGIRER